MTHSKSRLFPRLSAGFCSPSKPFIPGVGRSKDGAGSDAKTPEIVDSAKSVGLPATCQHPPYAKSFTSNPNAASVNIVVLSLAQPNFPPIFHRILHVLSRQAGRVPKTIHNPAKAQHPAHKQSDRPELSFRFKERRDHMQQCLINVSNSSIRAWYSFADPFESGSAFASARVANAAKCCGHDVS